MDTLLASDKRLGGWNLLIIKWVEELLQRISVDDSAKEGMTPIILRLMMTIMTIKVTGRAF